MSIGTLSPTLLAHCLWPRLTCLPRSFLALGCGTERLLEVLSDTVESLQTAPEKLGRSELAERSAWEGGEFAECPWPESLPSSASSQKRGEVGDVGLGVLGEIADRLPPC